MEAKDEQEGTGVAHVMRCTGRSEWVFGELVTYKVTAQQTGGVEVALAALVEGNNKDNALTGTNYADTICAYGGEDLVWALSGRDQIYGGYGNDHIVSRDLNGSGIGQRDVVDCVLGYDTFAADFDDRVLANCEEGSTRGS